jgi:hypothetical protein
LIGERPLQARARRWRVSFQWPQNVRFDARAADFVLVIAHPDGAASPSGWRSPLEARMPSSKARGSSSCSATALGPLDPPPSDSCLYNMGLYELGIDPAEVLPPIEPS